MLACYLARSHTAPSLCRQHSHAIRVTSMLTQREGHFLVQGRLRTDTVQPIDFYEGPSERYGMERGLSPGWPLWYSTLQQSHTTLNALILFHWYTTPLDYRPGGDHSYQQ